MAWSVPEAVRAHSGDVIRNDALAECNGSWPFEGDEESQARQFAERVCSDTSVALPPACTLDVGRLGNGTWAVIEANPCWGAGLYGCDPAAVLDALSAAMITRAAATAADLDWVSLRRKAVAEL